MEHKIPFGNSNRENGPTFLDFPLFLGIFQWDEPMKRVPFTAEPKIPEILTKWKAPIHKRHITLFCLLGKRLEIAFTCVSVRRHVYLWKGDWSQQFRTFFRFVPSIPDNQGYLRFSVFISQQNLGQSGNTKVPHRLGCYWLMKTRLKSSMLVSSSTSSVSCPFLLADAKSAKQLLIGTFESHSSLEKRVLLSSSLAFVISADTWLGCVFKAVFSPS